MTCARTGSADAVQMLIEYGAAVNAKEPSQNQTALMWAAAERHPDVVKALIQAHADLKAMSALGVFATTVVTAVTAQNSAEVTAVHPVPADVVDAQIAAVLDDFDVAATKTGMLATTDIVRLVARRAAAGQLLCAGGCPRLV